MILDQIYYGDVEDGGPYQATGNVINTDVTQLIRLHERQSGRVIRETWSNAGAYTFTHIKYNDYYIAGLDHTNTLAAKIADHILLVLM